MSVALAHAAFLPAAACFALLPLVSLGARTGNEEAGAVLDYDLARERVTLTAARDVRWSCRGFRGLGSVLLEILPGVCRGHKAPFIIQHMLLQCHTEQLIL